jgi:hypothetical protein
MARFVRAQTGLRLQVLLSYMRVNACVECACNLHMIYVYTHFQGVSLYPCMYVCVYVYVHTYTHTNILTHTCVYVCVRVYMNVGS